jgi:hypothetical protein
MTFLEAALEILRRERRPLHYKDIAQKAMDKKLLTFVGRTPEVTMQTQLTAAVKKAPGNPFVRVKPGTFGLLRYPEAPVAPEPEAEEDEASDETEAVAAEGGSAGGGAAAERGRRRRRGGRGRRGGREGVREPREAGREAAAGTKDKPATENGARSRGPQRAAREEPMGDDDDNAAGEGLEEPEIGSLSPEARAAALAEGVLGAGDQDQDDDDDGDDDDQDEASAAGGGEPDEQRSAAEQEEGQEEGDEDGDEEDEDDDDDEGDEDDEEGDDEEDEEEEEAGTGATARTDRPAGSPSGPAGERPRAPAGELSAGGAPLGDDDLEAGDDEGPGLSAGGAGVGGAPFEDAGGGRRRRRRRRRRGGGEAGSFGEGAGPGVGGAGGGLAAESGASGETASQPAEAEAGGLAAGDNGDPGAGRRIMSPVDAAIEILRGQAPGRGMHVRQLADAATRRRLVHGEPNEAWRVMRAALAAEPRERLRTGLRPRVRPAGSGLFALARKPPDLDLERAEHVFGEARRALRERTLAALEQRLTELSPSAFEAIARVLLQREGFGPATFVKRVEGTVYLECLRGRGARPSRCLVALRPGGGAAGRRSIGELRAGIQARGQDEGVLLLAARLAEDAIAQWKQPGSPIEVADGAALAETCVRHGVGVINTMVSVDFVDADFFAELQEG